MKTILLATFFLLFTSINAQNNSEVFLFNIDVKDNNFSIGDGKNISNNEGYDSQPSFLDDRYIIFSSDRKGQTDIAKYDTRYGSRIWINYSEGGEYTPLKIPNKNAISAVRLDKDGKQRLYSYSLRNGESTELIYDLVVAYYTWYDDNTVVSAVIENEDLNLYTTTINDGKSRKYATKVGRSFHKVPKSNLVSFISKSNENQWQIKSLNPLTGGTKHIANTIEGVEDMCWLNNKTIISSKGNTVYKLTLNKDNSWKKVVDIPNVKNISRIAVNTDATRLLIVAEPEASAETSNNDTHNSENTSTETDTSKATIEFIIQRNLDAYNAKNLDAFMKDYADDVKIYNYPNTLRTDGKETMRKGYQSWFERAKGLKAVIKKRIVIGNKVIDEEEVTANGQTFHAVAIYEVENGLITKVTFIGN